MSLFRSKEIRVGTPVNLASVLLPYLLGQQEKSIVVSGNSQLVDVRGGPLEYIKANLPKLCSKDDPSKFNGYTLGQFEKELVERTGVYLRRFGATRIQSPISVDDFKFAQKHDVTVRPKVGYRVKIGDKDMKVVFLDFAEGVVRPKPVTYDVPTPRLKGRVSTWQEPDRSEVEMYSNGQNSTIAPRVETSVFAYRDPLVISPLGKELKDTQTYPFLIELFKAGGDLNSVLKLINSKGSCIEKDMKGVVEPTLKAVARFFSLIPALDHYRV